MTWCTYGLHYLGKVFKLRRIGVAAEKAKSAMVEQEGGYSKSRYLVSTEPGESDNLLDRA